jgi:type IV pilus assembly protein PilE
MRQTNFAGPHRVAGYTLIELMIVVAVMGILATIAIPIYTDYVTRGRILDATTKLGDVRTQMEKYFMDNRTYLNAGACGAAPAIAGYNLDASKNFTLSCPGPTATTYTITATGIPARGMTNFVYTVDQANNKATPGVKPGWAGAGATCWVLKKDGSC